MLDSKQTCLLQNLDMRPQLCSNKMHTYTSLLDIPSSGCYRDKQANGMRRNPLTHHPLPGYREVEHVYGWHTMHLEPNSIAQHVSKCRLICLNVWMLFCKNVQRLMAFGVLSSYHGR